MIFALTDDRGIEVHADMAEVRRAHESVDVENNDVRFFDATGRPLRVVWDEPPTSSRFLFGLFRAVTVDRSFSLAPGGEGPEEFTNRILHEAAYLVANPTFASLEELRHHFAGLD